MRFTTIGRRRTPLTPAVLEHPRPNCGQRVGLNVVIDADTAESEDPSGSRPGKCW